MNVDVRPEMTGRDLQYVKELQELESQRALVHLGT